MHYYFYVTIINFLILCSPSCTAILILFKGRILEHLPCLQNNNSSETSLTQLVHRSFSVNLGINKAETDKAFSTCRAQSIKLTTVFLAFVVSDDSGSGEVLATTSLMKASYK